MIAPATTKRPARGAPREPDTPAVDAMLVPIDSIHPWARNPRTNEKAVAKVAASIAEFGWVRPIIANTHPKARGEIIVGHTARLAALQLGLTEVPVRWVNLEPRKAHAAALADNKLGEISGWDAPELARLLSDNELDRELFEVAGFTHAEVDRLLAAHLAGEDGSDAPVEPAAEPDTRPGDLYLLGRHRLVCGDSTNAADVALALGGAEPYLLVTDPPYGVQYDAAWRTAANADPLRGRNSQRQSRGKVEADDRADWREAWALAPCGVCYVWCAPGPLGCVVAESLQATGFDLKPQIIWTKNNYPMGRGAYHVAHELCWYGVRKGKPARFVGGRKQTTVWEIDRPPRAAGGVSWHDHSTQKPLECMARPIRNHEGDVYEPFCGSGTTIIAAEQLDRACYALEISPGYCDAIVARWEAVTGGKAERVRE